MLPKFRVKWIIEMRFYEFVCVEKMSKTKMPRDLGHRNRSVIKLA